MTEAKPPGPFSALGIGVVVATVAADQATKWLAEQSLPIARPTDLLPILSLYRIHNPGIAFSFLSEYGGLALVVLTAVISAAVLVFWWRSTEGGGLAAVGYGLIIGGAIGNLIDRILYGHVIDFLLLHFGSWTLFVFNLADTALTVGPAILLIVYLWPARSNPRQSS